MASTDNKINSFAVLGVGEIGLPIVNELLANNHEVRVLTRIGSTNASLATLKAKGARLVEVDYASESSLEAALGDGGSRLDVIISTLGGADVEAVERRVARVAVRLPGGHGTKPLFVPSMWGFDYASARVLDPTTVNPLVLKKLTLLPELDALRLPWVAVSNGLFSSWSFTSVLGIDPVGRTAALKVNGAQAISFTHLADIAAFVRHIATTPALHPSPGHGRWYYVEGYKARFDEVLAEAQRLDGDEKPWGLTPVPGAVEEARSQQLDQSGIGMLNWVLSSLSDGRALRGESDNESIGFTPKYGFQESVKEALELSRRG